MLVESHGGNNETCPGTAFVVGSRTLFTAGHIANSGVKCVYYDDERLVPDKTHYLNDTKLGLDVAVLEFASNRFSLSRPMQVSFRLPELGEQVAALGFPTVPKRDSAIVMHIGHVESLTMNFYQNCRFIQTTFQSGGGLSGSPLVDESGSVIGIMTETVFLKGMDGQVPSRPYGQAMPVEYAAILRRFPKIDPSFVCPSV
ncbi:MAG: serine protease [Planctomycetota bacterium]